MNKILLSLFFLFALITTSCGFRHIKDSGENMSEVSGSNGLTQVVSYPTLQSTIIGPKCISCHSDSGGNQGGLNLETYEQIKNHLESIKRRAVQDLSMPPKYPLSNIEKSVLSNWINNEILTSGTVVLQKKTTVKWSRVRDEIIVSRCIECHSPPTPNPSEGNISTMEAGLDLTKLEVVRAKADLIFKRVVIVGDMPLKPYPALNEQEKKLISQWMIDGMEDDEIKVDVATGEKIP